MSQPPLGKWIEGKKNVSEQRQDYSGLTLTGVEFYEEETIPAELFEIRHPNHSHILAVSSNRPESELWNCDVCPARSLNNKLIRFRCTERCDWDCCSECMSPIASTAKQAWEQWKVVYPGDGINVRSAPNLSGDRQGIATCGNVHLMWLLFE